MKIIAGKIFFSLILICFFIPKVFAEELKWQAMKDFPPGAEIAIISGDPDKAGPFTLRLKFPANYIVPAHSHLHAARAKVISGTYYIGIGKVADGNHGKPLQAGASFTIPPNNKHYGWTKNGAILEVEATGPWDVSYDSNG